MPEIAVYGLGRIGRTVARVMFKRGMPAPILSDLNNPEVIAYLLEHDTVYGSMNVPWKVTSSRPDGVKVVIDCSGQYQGARSHIEAGAQAVIISGPAPADTTLIYGVNHTRYDPERDKVISMASCTMNCIAPIIKLINSAYDIQYLNLVSMNAFTNSQRLVDAPHADLRLARAAGQNIIPSESSTKDTIGKIFPNLRKKYSALAFRVPVLCGSVCHLTMRLTHEPLQGIFHEQLKRLVSENWKGIVQYSEEPLVSSDVIGNPHSAVIDGLVTEIIGDHVCLIAWHDNEFGYANRLVDLANYLLARLEE